MDAVVATCLAITRIDPDAPIVSHRTGSLSHITAAEITARLGFEPTRHTIEGQSDQEWRFRADGHDCSIWDMHGAGRHRVWSTCGPAEIFAALFGWRAGR